MLDIFVICVLVFGIAIAWVVGYLVINNVNTEFQSKLTHTESKTIMSNNESRYVDLFDGIFLFVFFGSFIATIIGSLFIDTHPVFFFISMILLVIACVVCGVFANVYAELETDATMGTYTTGFKFISFTMQYFVQIVIFMTCSIAIALFAKSRYG